MFTSQPKNGTAGLNFPVLPNESQFSPTSHRKLSPPSHVLRSGTNMPGGEPEWRSATVFSSGTAAVVGWTNLCLAEDLRSTFPSLPQPDTSADQEENASRLVLLVEDNPTDIFVVKKVLAEAGINIPIRIARDGQDALQYLLGIAGDETAGCPVLVLLDLNLPKIDGLEVLRQLRAAQRCRAMPVVVVTSSGAESDRTAARNLHVDAYFQKPATLAGYAELGALVRRVLASRGEGPQI